MVRSMNKVVLIGNVEDKPEIRYTIANKSCMANLSLTTSRTWRSKQTGELQESMEWHRVVFFNHLAEMVEKYSHKGSKIYVEGSLRTRVWFDKNGNERQIKEVIATQMHLIDGCYDAQSDNRVGELE